MSALPVLWLYGAPGVGKTTVAWEFFLQLAGDGVPTGFVDIDQLGMCYAPPTPQHWAPEPVDDPGRHRLKSRTLDAVVANFRNAGARCVIVPGVVDPVGGIDADLVPQAVLTRCRLRADPPELERRLAARGRPGDDFTAEIEYANVLDDIGERDPVVDTTGSTVAEVVYRVRALTGWPELGWPADDPAPLRPAAVTGPVLLLCGPAAVGKSTVGWQVYQSIRAAGVSAAFVDLDQLGFYRPAPTDDTGRHRLKAANLAAVWRTFRARGAQCLIAVGPLDQPRDMAAYRAALPAATITVCRLHASRPVLADRVAARGRGETPTWGLAGDVLVGRSPAWLGDIAERAARVDEALDGFGDLCVTTDHRPPLEIAAEILQRTGWPS